MSQSSNAAKQSLFSKPPGAQSDIHLYERVRLQSFQGLLPGAQNRMRSSSRCPRVLLEDLLKAEVISLQLVLAIEDVVKFVKQNFGGENQNPGKEADRRCEWRTDGAADDGLLRRNFQNAFAQSANALVELTKLRISSDNACKENMELPGNTSCSKQEFNDSLETSFSDGAGTSKQSPSLENYNITKRLSYGSEKTNLSEPSWSFSVRVSDFSTAPSDITDIAESHLSSREGTECEGVDEVNIEDMAKDAVKTLRNEMEGLQIKHEKQFINYTAECLDLSQGENQNMREILKKIMENLTPQDQNWAYQGKFDEHGMEQLYYFILLQKTLKSCLAIIDTVNVDEKESMEDKVHPSKTQELAETEPSASTLHPTAHHSNQMLQYPSHHMYQSGPRKTNPESTLNDIFLSTTHPAQETACTAYVELSDDSKDHDDNCVKKHTAQMNGKRINEFEDEQEAKKQRKGIFSCFNTRWTKKRQKKAKKKE